MAGILILGAGVMGSAIAVPAADNGHAVTLCGTPLDSAITAALKVDRAAHPRLGARLPDTIRPLDITELSAGHLEAADVVIVGVSSAGIGWACERLAQHMREPKPVAFVTKGLDPAGEGTSPRTYAQTLPAAFRRLGLRTGPLIGIGGPCIARELAARRPTASLYACESQADAAAFAGLMHTPYYRLQVSADPVGVEACAALKNFYAIGVSAMRTLYPNDNAAGYAMNPSAAAFNQAVREIAVLCEWIGGARETAFDLAGLGDLHVTVGGGRNSRLGMLLGAGARVSEAMAGPLAGETVEGIDTGRNLASGLAAAFRSGRLRRGDFPLAAAILAAILEDQPFRFDFSRLYAAQVP